MILLPPALRRIQETQPAGYVVAILSPDSGRMRLTHADIQDRDGADTEAASWRKRDTPGSRVVVCAVFPVEQQQGRCDG